MFTLAWVFLADLPELRTGLIIVGLARCIAMVLIWNDLACGSRELAAVLVAINSLFQIVMYSVLGWFYLSVLPGWLGLDTADLDVSMWAIAKSVLIFLGIPLARRFRDPHHRRSPQGHRLVRAHLPAPHRTDRPLRAVVHHRRALRPPRRQDHQRIPSTSPESPYHCSSTSRSCGAARSTLGYRLRFPYDRNASVAFTAAGNNFELAIAVSIAVFGVTSGQALAGTIGPLIEVPALIALVYVSLWAQRRYYPEPPTALKESPMSSPIVILAGARTPIGKLSGALASFTAIELGGFAIAAALERAGLPGDQVDYVVHGPRAAGRRRADHGPPGRGQRRASR